jgi:hypothetical protein
MNKLVQLFVLLILFNLSTLVSAASIYNRGPEIITFKKGILSKPFLHWKHQERSKDNCQQCHEYGNEEGKIDEWPNVAHNICISCHEVNNKGPVKCLECHDK